MEIKEYRKQYYLKNKDIILKRSAKRYHEKRDDIRAQARKRHRSGVFYKSIILDRARQRARKRGIVFNITSEDINIPDVCPILGYKLIRNIDGVSGSYNSPSVDRIKQQLGYIKGNVHIISHKANMMKNNATKEELIKFAEWIINNKEIL